ncbi:MAG: ribose-phosphate pyrophosphokinase [Prolixibacteraceae bacterium]|jgi:ribose-phosphate pyrophosphokinase|nr:ribose-phosphate pyrophosphokinase [Prolixibacteraceae bacterium]
MKQNIKLFTGNESRYLSENIALNAGMALGKSSCPRFADGEFEPCYEETIRGCYTFIIQSTFAPSDNLLELLLMIDAAKRASAYKVIAVMPYFGFARQDRKDRPRVSIGAKLIADMLSVAGIDRLITMDLHADQIQGFFNVPVDHLSAVAMFIPHIKQMGLEDIVIASPDTGGTKRANVFAKHLGTDMVICHKTRTKANAIDTMTLIGEVEDKDVIIIDDIIDTAGTIAKAADLMKSKGARSVRACATHAVLSGSAIERLEASALDEVLLTDTIPLHTTSKKITVLTCAPLFADVIQKVFENKSISSSFI